MVNLHIATRYFGYNELASLITAVRRLVSYSLSIHTNNSTYTIIIGKLKAHLTTNVLHKLSLVIQE